MIAIINQQWGMDHNNQMMFRKPCIWWDIVEINLLIHTMYLRWSYALISFKLKENKA